jgi:hypothetical protein
MPIADQRILDAMPRFFDQTHAVPLRLTRRR